MYKGLGKRVVPRLHESCLLTPSGHGAQVHATYLGSTLLPSTVIALHCRYMRNGVHLEYKPDARRAHDGTVEYASRDAHIGAHSRRSDLEILGYNLVHWMSGTLPWMDNLKDPK